MKKQLTSYLIFSKKELNGILILFVLITLITVFPFVYSYFDEPVKYDLNRFKKEIALFKASAVEKNGSYTSLRRPVEVNKREPDYFVFDPNTASESEWSRLGLSPRQVKVLNNYRVKGGKFYKKEDLRKIYSITEAQYKGLEPYIKVKSSSPQTFTERKFPENKVPHKRDVVIELNAADSAMLDQLRGIGPAFASRIIKYRSRLGGFYDKNQLKEVYGMDSVRYAQIEVQVTVDASLVRKLNANKVTFEEIRGHPYLSFKHINAMIQYRKQHGGYTRAEDLKKVLIMNEEIIRKIEPYLSF
jgi:DNA uptake protein ComE-like DNA-binding protein